LRKEKKKGEEGKKERYLKQQEKKIGKHRTAIEEWKKKPRFFPRKGKGKGRNELTTARSNKPKLWRRGKKKKKHNRSAKKKKRKKRGLVFFPNREKKTVMSPAGGRREKREIPLFRGEKGGTPSQSLGVKKETSRRVIRKKERRKKLKRGGRVT